MTYEEEIERANSMSPFTGLNGIKVISMRDGKATVELTVSENTVNHVGTVQGGLIYTICDIAGGCAIKAIFPPYYVTVSGDMSYLKPGTGKKLYAEAEVVKNGRIAVVDVDAFNDERMHIAHGTFTYYKLEKE